MNAKQCLNCELPIGQEQNFCANCGQSTKIHRFTLGHFFHEGFHAFTHADKGFLYLLKELVLRPGIVAREYIAGKRKKYYNPFTFFLILAAFFVLSSSLKPNKSEQNKKSTLLSISKITDPEKKEQALNMYKRAMVAREFTSKHGNVIAMIAVPFFGLYFWLIYIRKPYNYSEHLVANLMFISFANLAFSLIVFPLQALFKGNSITFFTTLLGFLLQWIYLIVAYKGFLSLKGFWAVFKVTLGVLVGLMLWIVLTITATAIYVHQNWHFYEAFKYMGR